MLHITRSGTVRSGCHLSCRWRRRRVDFSAHSGMPLGVLGPDWHITLTVKKVLMVFKEEMFHPTPCECKCGNEDAWTQLEVWNAAVMSCRFLCSVVLNSVCGLRW